MENTDNSSLNNVVGFYEATTSPFIIKEETGLITAIAYAIITKQEDECFELILVYNGTIVAIFPFLRPLDNSLGLFEHKVSYAMSELINTKLKKENMIWTFYFQQMTSFDWLTINKLTINEISLRTFSPKLKDKIEHFF